MLRRRTPRRAVLDVVEGHYTAALLHHFHRIGVWRRLREARRAESVARQLGIEHRTFRQLLDFLARTTDIVERQRDRYVLAARYRDYRSFEFYLDKFLGAYGATPQALTAALAEPARARLLVDRRALARAFTLADRPLARDIEGPLRRSGVRSLLEVGCGLAPALRTLCACDDTFTGWATDADGAMCRAARRRVREEGLTARIRVRQADVRSLARVLPKCELAKIDGVFAQSLLNEFVGGSGEAAVRVLRGLQRLLPGRPLFIVDYLGELSADVSNAAPYLGGTLQDVAQILSGQGVPPPTHTGWAELYKKAGCELIGASEGTSNGVRWFLHALRL